MAGVATSDLRPDLATSDLRPDLATSDLRPDQLTRWNAAGNALLRQGLYRDPPWGARS